LVKAIYNSVQEEASRELDQLKAFTVEISGKPTNSDFDTSHIDQKHFIGREEQLA